jgi:hypothetical protein
MCLSSHLSSMVIKFLKGVIEIFGVGQFGGLLYDEA